MLFQIILSIILILYAILVSLVTKKTFDLMVSRGIKKIDAIYYNRKLVHILAGGVIALFVPLFPTPLFPLFSGIILAIFTYYSHRKDQMLYWFQNDKDLNDVSFCLMWGFTVFILWTITGSAWISIIPITFMASRKFIYVWYLCSFRFYLCSTFIDIGNDNLGCNSCSSGVYSRKI